MSATRVGLTSAISSGRTENTMKTLLEGTARVAGAEAVVVGPLDVVDQDGHGEAAARASRATAARSKVRSSFWSGESPSSSGSSRPGDGVDGPLKRLVGLGPGRGLGGAG